MSYIPLDYLPGVCKVQSPYAAKNRITDMDGCRFVAGFPEQIGDTDVYTTGFGGDSNFNGGPLPDTFSASGGETWSDFSGNNYLAIGDNRGFLAISKTVNLASSGFTVFTDATPLRNILTGTLTNPLDTTITSKTVTVHHNAHGLSTGDFVQLVAGSAIGGIQPVGVFTNITRVDANSYTFVNASAATSSVSGGGGTVTYIYFRVTLSSPFTTIIGTKPVKVTHTAHGAVTNDYVYIAGASAVGGVAIQDGVYKIQRIDADNYYIIFANGTTNATSSTSGGGSPTFQYYISQSLSVNVDLFAQLGWSLRNYGQQLLANPSGGTIYVWDPTIGGHAYPLYNAPSNVFAMFVTAERFIFALGTISNPKLLQWPDQTDPTQWTPAATNTANSRTLQFGNKLVGGISVRDGISLVFTDTTPYLFTYTGDSFVYNSVTAGENCGLVGPLAATVLNQVAYWFSGKDFYKWDGGTAPLPSDDVRDFVIGNFDTKYNEINRTPEYECAMGAHSAKNEVWFFWCSPISPDGTNDHNAIFHPSQNCFSLGTLPRQIWIDGKTFGFPVSIGDIFNQSNSSSRLFFMDPSSYNGIRTQIDSTAIYVTGSPIEISNGDNNMDLVGVIPDFERLKNTVNLILSQQQYPMDALTVQGTYALTTAVSIVEPRFGAKLVTPRLQQAGTSSSDFRAGLFRFEIQSSGARR